MEFSMLLASLAQLQGNEKLLILPCTVIWAVHSSTNCIKWVLDRQADPSLLKIDILPSSVHVG